MTGTSAGGMMLENLLCTSSLVQQKLAAAVDIIGGMGADFPSRCKPDKQVPLLMIHGTKDPVISYTNQQEVDGAKFLSTCEYQVDHHTPTMCHSRRHDLLQWAKPYWCSHLCRKSCQPDATARQLRKASPEVLCKSNVWGPEGCISASACLAVSCFMVYTVMCTLSLCVIPQHPAVCTGYLTINSVWRPPVAVVDVASMWQTKRKCSGQPKTVYEDKNLICSDYCGQDKVAMRLCGMKDVGHDLNTPYQGYPFSVAWWVRWLHHLLPVRQLTLTSSLSYAISASNMQMRQASAHHHSQQ